MKTTKFLLALTGLALTSIPHLQAQTSVLYFDPFTLSGESALNGSTPSDHGGTGADAWTAPDDGFTMDGTGLTVTAAPRWAALPFSPVDGNKYRVSMDMNPTHTGGDWFAIGFAETPTPSSDYPAQRLTGWLLTRGFDPGAPCHSFTGYGTDGGGQAGNFTGAHNISVVLDTTVANWSFEFFVDGVSQRGPVPFSTTPDVNPSIAYVTFGSYGSARGTMDNFKLENIFQVETGPPTIVTPPVAATVVLGGRAKFDVVAAGPKPITYQWYRGSQLLPGETSSRLTVSDLTVADNGSRFTVEVINDLGTTTTPAATLTVLNVPGPLIHKFNFTDGTANDSIGGITARLRGNATNTVGQLYLDGSEGGFAWLSDYAMPPSGSATVVAWFRTSSTVGKSARVFDFGSGTLSYLYFTPITDSGGTARLGFKAGEEAEAAVTYTPTLNDDREHVAAAVIDSTPTDTGANGTLSLYIDGTLAGSSDLNGTTSLASLDSGPQNYFGKSQWVNTGDLHYKGFIDEVRVYNTALTQQAIAALVPDANPAAAPSIDTHPKDTVADLGGSTSLVVGVTGSQPLSYQWRLNGNNLPGSGSSVLTLSNVTASDLGGYDVVVANSLGSVTSLVAQVSLSRWSFAAWSDDATSGVDTNYFYTHAFSFGAPANATINGLEFKGVAGGNPTVAGSFTLAGTVNVFNNDANNLPEGEGSRILANDFIYGGNPGTLTLLGLTPGKEYLLTLFAVAFESPGNRVVRFSADGGQNLIVDQDFFDADNGIRISYQYTADAAGSVIVSNTPVIAANTFHSYAFCNRLLNKVGTGVPPEITAQPRATSAAPGSSATFTVTALGSVPLSYQWWFGGTRIDGATSDTYTKANVQSGDFGSYSVVVANSSGSATSTVATLSLLRFSYTSWTDDASAGVDPTFVYTHAYNFGSATDTTINGVKFTGVAGANPTVAGLFAVTGLASVFNNDANNMADGTGGRTLANDFIYGGAPGTLTLQGLTPGTEYLLTLYSSGWEDAGRVIRFSAANGQELLVDQDSYLDNNGIRILYEYTADSSGSVTIEHTQAGPSGTFHTYGFSNRELQPLGTRVTLAVARGTEGSVLISWPQSATGFTLQAAAALGAVADWQAVNVTPVVVDGSYQVSVPASSGTQYFRLRK